jgi:hypothetical protein
VSIVHRDSGDEVRVLEGGALLEGWKEG